LQGLELVFVAVYQKALKLMYVDRLLERMKAEFVLQYDPKVSFLYPSETMRGPSELAFMH
jgi:signal recognition particle receptor subunit alpha